MGGPNSQVQKSIVISGRLIYLQISKRGFQILANRELSFDTDFEVLDQNG